MAAPLNSPSKSTVNLAAPGVKGSRIRRDPPPIAKKVNVRERAEMERRVVVTGVLVFAAAIFAAIIGWGATYNGGDDIRAHHIAF